MQVGHLFKRNKIGHFETKISSMTAFRYVFAHANDMCARQVISILNLCHTYWFW